jgi:hypothetical protein
MCPERVSKVYTNRLSEEFHRETTLNRFFLIIQDQALKPVIQVRNY